jgi:hypothetical protein
VGGIDRLNTEVDIRHGRRAISIEEFSKLVVSARTSGVRVQGFTGEQRARIYTMSYLTGLRKKGTGEPYASEFCLRQRFPDAYGRSRMLEALSEGCVAAAPRLRGLAPDVVKGQGATEKLFTKLERRKTSLMVKKDLELIGIAYETDEGIADFHAAGRHTHITGLFQSGASLTQAKELARHADIKTTMRNMHVCLKEQSHALAELPAPRTLNAPESPKEPAELQMRCNSGGAASRGMPSPDIDAAPQKRQNPCWGKGSGDACRPVAQADKVGPTGFEPATF